MKVGLKIYRGYANEQEIILFGHVFKKNTLDRYSLKGGSILHAYTVLQLFTPTVMGDVPVYLKFGELEAETRTMKDGFFRFAVPYTQNLSDGWHYATVSVTHEGKRIEETGELIKPYPGEYGLISDIDDTFLVSYSNNIVKKLYVLLTRNIQKRQIFEGVVDHYRLLSKAGSTHQSGANAFFYVSSSEWNLYNFIERFAQIHNMPKAVMKLQDIKTGLGDLIATGGGSHDHKFDKIKHLLEFYPDLKFILFGDDSQKDPFIYERIVKQFPNGVKAVYIRSTDHSYGESVMKALKNIESMAVETCYFKDSAQAIEHSERMGIIARKDNP